MFGVAPGASLSYTVNRRYEKTDDSLNQALQLMLNYIDVDILIIPSWGASNLMDDYDDYLGDRPSTRAATLRENIADTIFVTDVGGPSTSDSALEGLYDIEDNVAFVMSSRDNTSDTCEAVGRNANEDHSNCITVPHLVSGQFAADDNTNGQSYARYTENLSSGIVGGGLAVMKQMFRGQLSNTALVSRLLQTADKSGKYGSRQYGNGLMDLGAATNPWGVLSMGTRSSSVGSSSVSLDSTSLSLGAPLGDGLPQSLVQQEVAAFDSLGAPFWFPAASFTVPSQGASIATRLNHFLTPYQPRPLPQSWTLDFKPDVFASEGGHLALTHGASRLFMATPNGFAATILHHPQDSKNQSPLTGLTLSWTPTPFPDFTIQAGVLDEQSSLLGSKASGAFGQLSGQTLFLAAGLDTTMPGGWQLAAKGELGVVNPSVGSSQLIDHISPLTTSAFRLQASRPFLNGGAFRLSLAQPLRVDSGAAAFSLPTGRTQEGIILGQDVSASLAPTGRQLDLTAMVELPLAEATTLSLGATRSQQPQHQQAADAEWTLFTGWRAKW